MHSIKTAKRFVNEELGIHWRVDDTKESCDRLFHHLEVKTNFKPYFEKALSRLNLDDDKFVNGLAVADIGAGVCWTSGMLARHNKVRRVYAVDPSDNRLMHGKSVIKHLGVEDKVKIIRGTFLEPNIPEKVDLVLLCGSLHHCYDKEIDGLFSNIKRMLKPDGKVLIASEHYVNWFWCLKRMISYLYHFRDQQKPYYSFGNIRSPQPFGGEHWRTKEELERMFKTHGFVAQFFVYKGDLCKDKHSLYRKLGWYYYCAILDQGPQGR